MPRPRKPGAPEPKRRSRKGCWPCKARKVKCGEEKPACVNCLRLGEVCDYSIRLNWEGRVKKKPPAQSAEPSSSGAGMTDSNTSPISHQSPGSVRTGSANAKAPGSQAPLQFSVSTPRTWAPDVTRRLSHGTWDVTGLQTCPVTPTSLFDSSPVNYDPSAEKDQPPPPYESHVSAPSPEHTPQPSALAQHVTTKYEFHTVPPSRPIPYPSPSDTDLLSPRSISSLSALKFDSHSVSQPTSFLRQTMNQSSASSPLEHPEQPSPLVKRRKSIGHPVSSNAVNIHNQDPSQTDCPDSLGEMPFIPAPDPRTLGRLSVNSLLSQSTELVPIPEKDSESTPGFSRRLSAEVETVNFGLDRGYHDLDLNENDDVRSIVKIPSPRQISHDRHVGGAFGNSDADPGVSERQAVFIAGSYYAKPVRINVPRYLTPLPAALTENPINLMYFHHFLNHTARILVPHDCSENPFISVMPAMAVEDPNLLNLMLAYSASHRARFLHHREPSNRIAHWVSNVFPTLRRALDGPGENITDSHLATSIMLLSLEIISPSTFEVHIPWPNYLSLARDLFLARGVRQRAHPGNKVGLFLARWLGYLDIFASLSCRRSGPPLFEDRYWFPTTSPPGPLNEDDDFLVDCFTGFTPRTGRHLARLGGLAHQCDNERFDETGDFRGDWLPTEDIVVKAQALLQDMGNSRQRGHINGTHHTELENLEMIAIDEAFHWSAVLHLYRRVLGKPASAPEVGFAVTELVNALDRIRPRSSTEVSVLFPLFTAGCEAQDAHQRSIIAERVKNFEAEGLKQIKNARQLMERCWKEGLPWVAIAQGEFLG